MDPIRRRLAELVAIDSVSSRPNAPIIEHLGRAVEALGLKMKAFPFVDDAGVNKVNLVAATRFDAQPGLALVGHTDTVPFDLGWAQALRLEESDGKLYGRGACDTKGFIACALEAATRVNLKALRTPLALIFTADEEVGCVGAKKLAEARAIFPRHAIVGEPTSLTPVRAHKGYCLARVELIGKEGHSAYPKLGASAIFAAGHMLARIDDYAHSLEKERHPDFDPPYTTLNVGIVRGGEAPNVIAGSCRFTLEWRPVPGEQPQRVLDAVHRLSHEVSVANGVGASIKALRLDKGLETATTSEVVRYLAQVSGKAAATVSYATEAPHLAEMGAQVAVFGPGDIRVAHATGEHVPIDDLHKCTEVLAQAIVHFCA
jgi:acetylornithine deacetylase